MSEDRSAILEHTGHGETRDVVIVNAAGSEAPASVLVVVCSCGWESEPSAIREVVQILFADHLERVLPTGLGVPGMDDPDG